MANVFPLSFPPRPSNPSPFGFGFGGGGISTSTPSSPLPSPSSFGSPLRRPSNHHPTTPSSSFGRPYQPPSPSVFGAPSTSFYGTSAASPSGANLKRKSASTSTSTKRRGREDDEDDDEDEDSDMGAHHDNPEGAGGRRQIAGRRGGKKSRVDQSEPTKLDSPASPAKPSQQDDGVDVGVLLALLPSTSLLPILTSLATLHPELKSTLLSLIPTPSLSSALEALRLADEKVRLAVPFGWSPVNQSSSSRGSIFGGGGGVSESYVLGRIQGSVGELASLIQSHLPYFTTTPTPHHPTTTFPYLQAITTLLLRLSSTLPSPLTSLDILWPRIAEEWLRWIASVDQLVNKSGGMVGAGVADGWIRELDSLASRSGTGAAKMGPLEERMKNEMGVVRDRWVQEVGWLVNRRVGELPPGHAHGHGHGGGGDVGMGMEEEEL